MAQTHSPQQLELALDTPDNAPPQPRGRHIVLGQQIIEYALRRSRRNSIGFSIGESGLRVTAPHWVTGGPMQASFRKDWAIWSRMSTCLSTGDTGK